MRIKYAASLTRSSLQRRVLWIFICKFQQDLLAGLTVAAVALPLALAFGVASGSTASARAGDRHHRRSS
ncbi:SulP family inorganic anion transporter [Candidatus Villigracilis saccharophilus]|uniref:SulP family inorganic anion transporter n=1 Tax=Candidatus Villigracilis saccharophilus TaxID=3140684 RepID=UPI0031EDA091